jgi:oligosaccharide repeat unit polymerase
MSLFMFFGAWMAESVRQTAIAQPFAGETVGYPQAPTMPRALVLGALGSLLALAPYAYFLILVRAGDFESTQARDEGYRTYFLSHLATLSAWLENESLAPSDLTWGKYTISGLLGRLGLVERSQPLYESIVFVWTGDISNLYTAFRGLLEDFGSTGTVVLLLLSGATTQHLYQRAWHGGAWATALLAFAYFIVMLSFLYSPFIFNNIIVVFFMFLLVVPYAYPLANAQPVGRHA